jgi:hypothetical protein
MPTLFDMFANAQDGRTLDLLARQFNLSQQQTQLAVEALMPAFSQGLKRNTADPNGLAGFLSALASGQHARYFEDAQNAFSPQGVAEGNGILGHLFGSKDLSRAVAAQAAQATGLGPDLLKQMLPVIASMLMGGLFKQSTGQAQSAAPGAGGNPLGEIIEQMMKQGGGLFGQPSAGQPQSAGPLDNPFGKILEGMFGGGQPQQDEAPRRKASQPAGQNPFGADNPFGKILQDMLGGGAQAPQTQAPRTRVSQAQAPQEQEDAADAPRRTASGRPRNPYDDLFGEMFESGARQRDDYQKSVESIFEQFTRGMDRSR